MTDPEQNAAPSSDDLLKRPIPILMEDFCRAMNGLNRVALDHLDHLCDIAVRVKENFSDGSARSRTSLKAIDNSDLVNQVKANIESVNRDSQEALKNVSASTSGVDILPQRIKQALSNAADNSVANQQQLNLLSQEILIATINVLRGNQPAE